jgi:K(+)-stimulated pyrophosphate-energized sodium pump
LAIGFNKITDHFTNPNKKPIDELARSARTGAATEILGGISLGFESTVWNLLMICITIVISVVVFSGSSVVFMMYGVALSGIGMLTLTGNNVSMDAFGPIVDNAGGILRAALGAIFSLPGQDISCLLVAVARQVGQLFA